MGRYFILFAFLLFNINTLFAGNSLWGWFHFTPKAGLGTSMMVNKTMFDHFNATPRLFNFSYMYGGQLGAAFLDNFDFSVELSRQGIGQLYWVGLDDLKYSKKINITSNEYGGFFKLMGSTGYFEIGATVSKLHNISVDNDITSTIRSEPVIFNDNTDYFNDEHYQLAVGFGASLLQVDLLEITFGLRIKYGVQPLAKGPELPLLDGVYPSDANNSQSNSNDLSFMLELNVHNFFGFFGRAICGSRAVVFFQKPKKMW